ncbi:Fat storage-inducing transmembrane protein [Phycomyces nitens]|nr:Fat storage-inducing transmembrane protein [Phycomyces nitens]
MPPSSHSSSIRNLPLMLKPYQNVLVSLYLITVFLGFLYSSIQQAPISYFSLKSNVFNKYFVKIGWFWVTVLYLPYLFLVISKAKLESQRFVQGLGRYIIITAYWYIMTQWFFGPSIIDRVFVATGGHCSSKTNSGDSVVALNDVFQQSSCRRLGGQWTGGHDVSGHCVMLIHASLFLWEELSWVFSSIPTFQRVRNRGGLEWYSIVSIFCLLGLWWWMVLMTSVYFHGHFELMSGCFFGILGWAVTVSV